MQSVSDNIMLGQLAPVGTGAFDLLLDDKALMDAIDVSLMEDALAAGMTPGAPPLRASRLCSIPARHLAWVSSWLHAPGRGAAHCSCPSCACVPVPLAVNLNLSPCSVCSADDAGHDAGADVSLCLRVAWRGHVAVLIRRHFHTHGAMSTWSEWRLVAALSCQVLHASCTQ